MPFEEGAMTDPKIGHGDVAAFAIDRVNLPQEHAQEYREQVNRLRVRLEKHMEANPGFDLRKTIYDLDVAVYVEKEKAPIADKELVPWLGARLREAYSDLAPDQFDESQPHCVTISFKSSGLDVDVVPVLFEGDADDRGYLVDKDTGERLLTSIPLHIEFIRKRKKRREDYAQVVRLAKWWAYEQKRIDTSFKCKSFLLELLIARHVDLDRDLSNHARALEMIFSDIVRSGLSERVAFSDYYPASKLPKTSGAPIEVFDPVNPENNIASAYSEADRERLVSAAEQAADAISEAHYATTKARAIECWQLVFGTSFRG
jgi:tRNA nucleotidyltransferase (CCA-adding enzyme)